MGRWGDGNFESDSGLDHQHILLMEVVKDIVFWLSPLNQPKFHRSYNSTGTLSAVEMLTRICEHYDAVVEIPSHTVREWCETYLRLYDAAQTASESDKSDYPDLFSNVKRQEIVDTFARLEVIVRPLDKPLWNIEATDPPPVIDAESIRLEIPIIGHYVGHFIRRLADDISLRLAPENLQDFGYGGNVEHIRADMDMLVFTGSTYKCDIGRNTATIRLWRDTLLKTFDEFTIQYNLTDEEMVEEKEERQIIVDTFEKLEALAIQYPTWSDYYGKEDDDDSTKSE